MPDGKYINVKIGEIGIGRDEDLIKTTLGSCVGIAFVWRNKNIFGLAHCLLPESTESGALIGARFVSQAVPSLIAMMRIRPKDKSEISVYIAGGGNMLSQIARKNTHHIGLQNIEAARKYLQIHGFKFTELELAGDNGLQMFIECWSGNVSVLKLEKFG